MVADLLAEHAALQVELPKRVWSPIYKHISSLKSIQLRLYAIMCMHDKRKKAVEQPEVACNGLSIKPVPGAEECIYGLYDYRKYRPKKI